MVFLVLMENEKLWFNEMGYVRCNGHAASSPSLPLLSSGGTLLSLSSFTASSNGQFLSFQLSLLPSCSDRLLSSFLPLSPLTHPPARRPPSLPRRSSVWSWSLSYIASFLSCHPRPSGRHRARERAPPPRTDQPANGQTVGRSLFRCHRGRPERAKHVSEGVSGLAVSETV